MGRCPVVGNELKGCEITEKVSKLETSTLHNLGNKAGEAKLHSDLEVLFEDFCRWADNGYSSMEMVKRIQQFH